MKAFIVNFNRLTCTRRIANHLADCDGVQPIIIDNNSDYPPLLDYYRRTSHRVVRLKENMGSPAVWESGILDDLGLLGGFIVTDPDLDISSLPDDWVHELQIGLDLHDFALKAGVGLVVDDLPDTLLAQKAREWEAPHWAYPLDDTGRFYKASTSTTLCLCRNRVHDFPSVRTGPPYVVRHLPWYYTSRADIPEDELYYMSKVGDKWNYWTRLIKDGMM